MSVSASVLPSSLAVEPGGQQSCWIQIRNTGQIVDEFVFEVLGDARDWVELDPPKLSLFPAAEGELKLTFRPPRTSSTAAGVVPFGLKVTSSQNPDDAFVEEGTLAVAPFYDTGAELTPRTSHARLLGRHELAFDNRGNTLVNGQLEGFDADNALTFAFNPPALVAAPGSATFAKVRARPRKRFLRGQPKTLPFQVRVKPEAGEPRVVDGAVVQDALIPKWLVLALLALAALVVLWAAFLKPQIESTARDAVKAPLRKQQKAVTDANAKAAAAAAAAQQAKQAATNAAGSAAIAAAAAAKAKGKVDKVALTVTNAPVTPTSRGTAKSLRLQVACPPTCTVPYPVPNNQTFSLTDIVLGNPQGDTGTLTLKNGDEVLLVESLQNFRDLDYHFIAPIVVSGGTKLAVVVQCTNPSATTTAGTSAGAGTAGETATATPATGPCSAAASLAGFVKTQKKPAQQPKP